MTSRESPPAEGDPTNDRTTDPGTDVVPASPGRQPNYFIRRGVAIGGVVAAIALGAVAVGSLIDGGGDGPVTGAADADWSTIVLVDARSGQVILADIDGEEQSRFAVRAHEPDRRAHRRLVDAHHIVRRRGRRRSGRRIDRGRRAGARHERRGDACRFGAHDAHCEHRRRPRPDGARPDRRRARHRQLGADRRCSLRHHHRRRVAVGARRRDHRRRQLPDHPLLVRSRRAVVLSRPSARRQRRTGRHHPERRQ